MHVHLSRSVKRLLAAVGVVVVLLIAASVTLAVTAASGQPSAGTKSTYSEHKLVSDLPGMAVAQDPNLVNAWGLSHGSTTPWWVSNNGTGTATLYDGAGKPFPAGKELVVTVPPPRGSAAGAAASPTGNIFNGTSDFVVTDPTTGKSGPALFLFVTEDGTISGWSPTVNPQQAILAVDNSAGGTGAVYKGLALGQVGSSNLLYAANFRAGTVDVFDARFAPVHVTGAFTDATIPAGFAPFNITNVGGQLYVTYAKQNAAKHDDVAGPGNGFVDVFTTSGQLVRRFATQGALDSPWGLTQAPAGFGQFSGDVLIGNFGDGRINAFDPRTGALLGALQDAQGHAKVIPGLWGLAFGNGGSAGPTTTLFFTAGIDHEAHGLFGTVTLDPSGGSAGAVPPAGPASGGYGY